MGYHIPGTVILYRESGSSLPLWPSIYCTDEIAPETFSRNRPSGFYSLVLKLARVLDSSQLRWALTSEMHEFDPSAADEETKKSTTGLEDAYDVAVEALQHGLDLDHWKSALATEQVNGAITIDSEDNDDWSNEPQMLEAIRLGIISAPLQKVAHTPSPPGLSGICTTIQSGQRPSRPAHSIPHLWDSQPSLSVRKQTQQPSRLPTPTPSPPRKTNPFVHPPRLPKRPSPPSPAYSDDKTSSLSRRRKLGTDMWRQASSYQSSLQLSQSTISPNPNFSDGEEPLPRPRRRKSSTVSVPKTQTYLPPQQACESNKAAGSGLSSKEVFMRNGLNASVSAVPDDDIIEGDLDESNQFVRIFIGPEIDPADDPTIDPYRRRHKLRLLKHHLWDRSYFRGDNLSGRNYITPVGDNTWELVHPRLVDISPEDFRWAAEFLSDGDFGIRKVEDEEQAAETFAQCVSAWRTAESLSMDDLLEHIVEKLRNARPFWDLWNVFAFACSIYQSEVSLQAHDELKDLFSEFIANHFYIYVEDDHLRNTFLTRLKQLPELEKDVLLKIVARLTQQLSPQDEEIALPEEIEEVTEDHMDLYE